MTSPAEVVLYDPQLPATPANSSPSDYIAALREVDNAATWVKVRITGLLVTRHGDGMLQRAADETGIALSTLKNWRKVDKAYPAAEYGRPYFSVGVAEAFCALADRGKLVSREQPWTVAEARALAASRKDPPKTKPAKTEPKPVEPKPVEPELFEVGGQFVTLPHAQAAIANLAGLAPKGSVSNALKLAGAPGVNYHAVATQYRAAHPGAKKLTTGECVRLHLLELTGQAAAPEPAAPKAPSLASENAELRAWVAALTAENDQLRAENAELRAKLSALDDIKEGAS